jgi:hypothetical protein
MKQMYYRLVTLDEDDCPPLKAFRIAVRDAIAYHHKLGHPVAFERGGRVIWLFPDGREIADEDLPESG